MELEWSRCSRVAQSIRWNWSGAGVAGLYRVLDGYLSDYLNKRKQIKPDGHYLPRAVLMD